VKRLFFPLLGITIPTSSDSIFPENSLFSLCLECLLALDLRIDVLGEKSNPKKPNKKEGI